MHVMKKGILYAVLASVLWAIVNPFIKQGWLSARAYARIMRT